MMRVTLAIGLAASLGIAGCDNGISLEVGPRSRSTPALRTVDSCDELESTLRAHIKEEMRIHLVQTLDQQHYGLWRGGGDAVNLAATDDAAAESGGRQEGTDYSGTNNQEAGVDEADFVKTDGYYIYVLNGDRLEILGVPEFGELEEVSTTELEGRPTQMLVGDDRAVVFSVVNAYDLEEGHPLRAIIQEENGELWCWYPVANITKLTVLDITNRATPTVKHELYLEGYYQTARKVDSSVRMVSYVWMEIPDLLYWPNLPDDYYMTYNPDIDPRNDPVFVDAVIAAIEHNNEVIDNTPLADLVPQLFERSGGEIVAHPFTNATCSGFSIADDATSRGFTSIISLDLLDDHIAFDADHVLSNWPVVYASTDTLVLAERANDWWWYWNNDDFLEATNLHRFDTSTAGETRYTGSGRIDGTVEGQFSLSEHEDNIRVASTTGQWNRWWMADPDPAVNHVFVLAGENRLETVGHLGGIAEGERLWSARFVGDKAFLVTFRNIDPLWTIDLSDPTEPFIKGELEIPGVSTYIHPVEDGALLTIGFGGTDTGLDWSNQVSLFDVSDFGAPALDDQIRLGTPSGSGWNWSWSEATYEHKAFQYWGPETMLAVPVGTYRYGDYCVGSYSCYEYYSHLELIRVDTAAGDLSFYGAIDHTSYYDDPSTNYWYKPEIRRSIFMGDYIYAISDRAVTAHLLDDLSLSAAVRLPGTQYTYWW